jgi:hypothetical protein
MKELNKYVEKNSKYFYYSAGDCHFFFHYNGREKKVW